MTRRLFTVAVVLSLMAWSEPTWAGRLHPSVEQQLRTLPVGGTVSVIVEMVTQADPAAVAATAPGRPRAARARAAADFLRDVANRYQGPIQSFLAVEKARGLVQRMVPLWVFNGLAVTATPDVIRALAARPDVWEVRADATIPLPTPVPSAISPGATLAEWNIDQIRAPEVWALNPAYTGVGTVVGSFDTGVDGTHPDLESRYRGNHAISWFDPYGEHESPFDFDGHGTHTTGIAVGGDAGGTAIGVAPGARWIAAKAWNDQGLGFVSSFHQIFEWFLAPGGDPANAPDVVNASWAFAEAGCIAEFLADVQALRAAGIFVSFAAGNDGPDPGSVRSPGTYAESFAVGATDVLDEIAFFSARGPSVCDGTVKPNVAAPGVDVLSSFPGGYAAFSGTSMAAPHVTGAVAVLRSIDPTLTVSELESLLTQGVLDLGVAGPDDDFGAGRLDLFTSAQILIGGADRPTVTVVASSPTAQEAGTVPGVLTVTRTGPVAAELTVRYTVGGSATPGADYTALLGSVTIPAQATTATIVVIPADDPEVELDETVVVSLSVDDAYIVGAPGRATVTLLSDEVPPDLVIAVMSAPTAVGAGIPFTVTETTRNQGGGPADASTTSYYLSADGTFDAADILLGSRAIPALTPGASHTGSVSLTVPAATPAGTYSLLARADAGNTLVETVEENNVRGLTLQIGPDLVVAAVTAPPAADAAVGFTVSDTTKNQGGGPAAASTTTFYLSTNSLLDGGDVLLGSRAVPALGPGATDAGSATLTIPAGTAAGTYYLLVRADGADAVSESVETNNVATRTIRVGADLVISALTVPPAVGAGVPFTVTDTTSNTGAGSTSASMTSFYLSGNAFYEAGDVLLGSRAVPALGPGASSTGSATLTIPAGTPVGSYYLVARADATQTTGESLEDNNVLARIVQVGPDLVVAVLTVPSAVGAGLPVTVTDMTKNQGGGSAGASTTTFHFSTDTVLDGGDALLGSRAVPALGPGASHTGSVTLTMPAGVAPGTYYIFARADATGAVTENVEGNNATLGAVQLGPDLIVASLVAPAGVGAGAAFTVTETTKNQGGGPADASMTGFYLSTNGVVDAGDIPLGSRAIPALGPGGSHAGSTTLIIPAGTPAGSYYLLGRADAGDTVGESLEANNVKAQLVQVGGDLIISSLTVASAVGVGVPFSVTDTTKNQGPSPVDASTTGFYLSTNAVLDSADIPLGGRAVPALGPGVSNTGTATLTIPIGTPAGSYYLLVRADASDAVGESAEGNNVLTRLVQVGADLVVSALTPPATLGPGVPFTVNDTTKNQGGSLADASTTGFYLSTNSTLDAADIPLGSRAVPALGPGATHAASTTLTIPAGTPAGAYYLLARADDGNAVGESSEANNVIGQVVQFGADLVVSALSLPSAVSAGVPFTVTDTTKNQGGGPADTTTTSFYLSTNAVVDAADVALGSRAVPALAPGASQTGSVVLTIPAETPAGSYYLLARADGLDTVAESAEGNNVLARTVQFGSDLVVSTLTAPAATGAGLSFTVTDTTRNQGSSAAAPSTTGFYLSTNVVLEAGDVSLGSRAVPALGPGATDTGSVTLTMPSSTASGSYYLLARADATDAVGESVETNNVILRAIQVGPDLIITTMSAPSTVATGSPFTVTDTTRNQGGSPAGTSTITFYLSSNSALDAGDLVLGSRIVPVLGAGVSDSGSATLTVPAGTSPGTYYLFARADSDNAVVESLESNNLALRTIQVTAGN
jgi:subtilase family serine protease/subtilisin family serine protease